MTDLDRALLNPASIFASPDEVLAHEDLSHQQKIEILRRWEYDERELQVAEEENMAGGPSDMLDEILRALHELGAGVDTEHSPLTKQGGI